MKIADSRLLSLIQLSLKTRPLLLREPFNLLSLVTRRRILFGISEVALYLLLIAVAFCMSQGVHLLAPWLQIPAEGSSLEHNYTCNRSCSFALLHPCKLCSILFPLLVDSMVGEDSRGKRAAEGILEENMPANQRLRRMR